MILFGKASIIFSGIFHKNPDLWKRFLAIYNPNNTKFEWVKGHNNHMQNERCDELAVEASKKTKLQEDFGYINQDEPLF